ncbi:hypothetical protein LGM43_07300 [Burkholderia seminalis]|nr:hypothetical protein [Burkholderia seminalis]MCA7950074.1 hypothetical protein [Burkholderia seminalis]
MTAPAVFRVAGPMSRQRASRAAPPPAAHVVLDQLFVASRRDAVKLPK